jgi:hypothetical protein
VVYLTLSILSIFILTAANIKIKVFWDVTSRNLVGGYQCFIETCWSLHWRWQIYNLKMFFWNVGTHLSEHTASDKKYRDTDYLDIMMHFYQ